MTALSAHTSTACGSYGIKERKRAKHVFLASPPHLSGTKLTNVEIDISLKDSMSSPRLQLC